MILAAVKNNSNLSKLTGLSQTMERIDMNWKSFDVHDHKSWKDKQRSHSQEISSNSLLHIFAYTILLERLLRRGGFLYRFSIHLGV